MRYKNPVKTRFSPNFALSCALFALFGAASLSAQTPVAHAQRPASVATHSTWKARQELAALYQVQDKAMRRGDMTTFANTLSSDYQLYFQGEAINREQAVNLAAISARFYTLNANGFKVKPISYTTKFKTFAWRGNDAVVWVEERMVLESSYNGKSVRSETVQYGREFWSPTTDGWKLRQSFVKSMRVWRNGQKVYDTDEL